MSQVNEREVENVPSMYFSVKGGAIRWRPSVPAGRIPDGGRGAVVGLSQSAAGRMRRYLSSCDAEYRNMVTLTYPHAFPHDGRVIKDHLRRFIQESQRHCRRCAATPGGIPPQRWSAFWFLEFQERGAPHFHIFITHDIPKEWVALTWYRIVGSDDVRHLHAGTRIESLRSGRGGSIAYAQKYAAKAEQKTVPEGFSDVGRFWGVSGLRSTVAAAIVVSPSQAGGVTGRLGKLKDMLRDLSRQKRAIPIRDWLGNICGYYVRNVMDQRMLARQLEVIAAVAAVDGSKLLNLSPLIDEHGYMHDEFKLD